MYVDEEGEGRRILLRVATICPSFMVTLQRLQINMDYFAELSMMNSSLIVLLICTEGHIQRKGRGFNSGLPHCLLFLWQL